MNILLTYTNGIMKKLALLLVMVLGVIPTIWADISVQNRVFDGSSQSPIVGGVVNGHISTDDSFGKVADIVDLGLSVKWASWNIGASEIGDYGGLYGAGDPTGLEISTNAADYYFTDGESICGTDYDLAHVLWGGNWRMPTFAELKELKEKCIWEHNVNVNGVWGSLATGPNGNSIFIPYAGCRHGNEILERDYRGSIFSGDMGTPSYVSGYMDLDILNDGRFQMDGCRNWVGQSIRPVYVEQADETIGTVADFVDLGLSVKWASWNMGADRPEGLGDLYAWGELSPKTEYSISTYKFYSSGYTKYGSIDNKYQLDSEDDVAQQTWGDNWRIPTIEELKELKEKCTFTKTELNGVPVTKVTGPNGNYIYFPYPGNFTGTTLYYENSIGSYWSSDLESDSYARDLDFISGMPSINGDSRYHGQSIRPVYVEQTLGKVADIVDLGLSVKWASWNLGASLPEEYGCYFAWGETAPKKEYDWSTYKFGDSSYFTKYNSTDGLTQLELEDDAANVLWGEGWRMPTHEEELELFNMCSWEDVMINGVSGYRITGPNGNSIFMPRGGIYDATDFGSSDEAIFVNTNGWYWSSTLNSTGSSYAQGLCFYPSPIPNVIDHERCDGHNIRPVYVETLPILDDNGGVDYGNDEINEDSDLNGNVIGNIYYNISDDNGEYSSTEGCIILRKPTSDEDMNSLEGQDIFGEDFTNGFTGIVFLVQGSGTITINAETVGNMTLKVKIGSSAPITMELEGKMKVSFPYSVSVPTYVYIYCGETSTANAIGLRYVSANNALKIYGVEWNGGATSIGSVNKDVVAKPVIYNLKGQRIENPGKGIFIKNGRKFVVK